MLAELKCLNRWDTIVVLFCKDERGTPFLGQLFPITEKNRTFANEQTMTNQLNTGNGYFTQTIHIGWWLGDHSFIDESLDPSVEMGGRDCIDGGASNPDDGWIGPNAFKVPTSSIDDNIMFFLASFFCVSMNVDVFLPSAFLI